MRLEDNRGKNRQEKLNKALPTRARASFSHSQSLPSGSLQKPQPHLSEGRQKKKPNPTATKTETIFQNINQDESYVPDEGTG